MFLWTSTKWQEADVGSLCYEEKISMYVFGGNPWENTIIVLYFNEENAQENQYFLTLLVCCLCFADTNGEALCVRQVSL